MICAILLAGLIAGTPVVSAQTAVYSTGFELTDGFTNGVPLNQQSGWMSAGSGSNGIVSGIFPGLGQQAYLGFPAPDPTQGGIEVWKPLSTGAFPTNQPWISFSVLLSIAAWTNGQADYFDWSFDTLQGSNFLTLDFDNYSGEISYSPDAGTTFIPTGLIFSNNVTYELQAMMNLSNRQWSATFGGIPLVSNQTLIPPGSSLSLGEVAAVWLLYDTNSPGNDHMVFDNYQISTGTNPPASSTNTFLYATDFEGSAGYTHNIPLDQQGWQSYGSGSNGVVSGFFPGLGQQGYIGAPAPKPGVGGAEVWWPLNLDPIAMHQPVVTFSVLMGIESSTNGHSSFFDWIVYNTNGSRLFTLDFDNSNQGINYQLDGTNQFVSTRMSFADEVPYRLNITMDFSQNRWSADLGGSMLATNQPITTTNAALNLGDIDAAWTISDTNAPGNDFMVFDNYQFTAPTTAVPSATLTFVELSTNGSPVLRLTSQPNERFAIEASTNLINWTGLSTNTTAGGSFDFIDPATASIRTRFYRGRWVP